MDLRLLAGSSSVDTALTLLMADSSGGGGSRVDRRSGLRGLATVAGFACFGGGLPRLLYLRASRVLAVNLVVSHHPGHARWK